jgi:hypothetical protein
MNRYAIGFRWVVLLGVLVNLLFAVPGIFVPNTVIGLAGGPPTVYPIWPAFSSLLLLLLSLFYIPAALAPFRYPAIAWLAVAARWAGVWFFLILQGEYPLFGLIDLFFGVAEGVLLILAYRRGPIPAY